jgi:hypothetical protein
MRVRNVRTLAEARRVITIPNTRVNKEAVRGLFIVASCYRATGKSDAEVGIESNFSQANNSGKGQTGHDGKDLVEGLCAIAGVSFTALGLKEL